MYDKDTNVVDRMKTALGLKKDKDLADYLGVARGTVANYKRRKKAPADTLIMIQEKTGYSAAWMQNGTGTPLMRPPSDQPSAPAQDHTPGHIQALRKEMAELGASNETIIQAIMLYLEGKARK